MSSPNGGVALPVRNPCTGEVDYRVTPPTNIRPHLDS